MALTAGIPARSAAIELLNAVLIDKTSLDNAMTESEEFSRLHGPDRAFARMYGVISPRPMPWASYGLFFSRDLLAMAFIFSLPPIVSPLIKERSGLSKQRATVATQLATPVISQLFTTPLHLVGLSIYNHANGGVGKHMETLRTTYPSTVVLRMLRIIPAFSVGGVVNRSVRQTLHATAV